MRLFGSITQPYLEEYRPEPFSRRFVRHLPGWYAQKHPDEDWAETFAVWMTPGLDWRAELRRLARGAGQAGVLRPADGRAARPRAGRHRDELDEDVGRLAYSVEQYYRDWATAEASDLPPGLDGALRAIFEDLGEPEDRRRTRRALPAADLIRQSERDLIRPTSTAGPATSRSAPARLLRHLAERADALRAGLPGRPRDAGAARPDHAGHGAGDEPRPPRDVRLHRDPRVADDLDVVHRSRGCRHGRCRTAAAARGDERQGPAAPSRDDDGLTRNARVRKAPILRVASCPPKEEPPCDCSNRSPSSAPSSPACCSPS